MQEDLFWMNIALSLAESSLAFAKRYPHSTADIPIGCVITREHHISSLNKASQTLITTASNHKENSQNPLHHAESMAIQQAATILQRWRLYDCTLYTTLEPCVMCSGAIINARIKRVVFAAFSPKSGGLGSLYDLAKDHKLNHSPKVISGLEEARGSKILTEFFALSRQTNHL